MSRRPATDHIADAGKLVSAATGTIWPASTPDSERRWTRIAACLLIIAAAACVAISFGVLEP